MPAWLHSLCFFVSFHGFHLTKGKVTGQRSLGYANRTLPTWSNIFLFFSFAQKRMLLCAGCHGTPFPFVSREVMEPSSTRSLEDARTGRIAYIYSFIVITSTLREHIRFCFCNSSNWMSYQSSTVPTMQEPGDNKRATCQHDWFDSCLPGSVVFVCSFLFADFLWQRKVRIYTLLQHFSFLLLCREAHCSAQAVMVRLLPFVSFSRNDGTITSHFLFRVD